jgi:hypothetical protein
MAEKDKEEAATPTGDQPDAAAQMLLEAQKDPEAQGNAENSVHGYVRERLENFIQEMDTAFDAVEAWVISQSDDRKAGLNQGGYFDFLGGQIEAQLFALSGGPAPLMTALVGELHNANDFAARTTPDISLYLAGGPRSGLKYGAWFVRDAVEGLLGDKWRDVLSLATNESSQFIPALHQLGIPKFDFDPLQMAAALQASSEQYLATTASQQDEVKQADGIDSGKQAELEQSSKNEMIEESAKPKEAATA